MLRRRLKSPKPGGTVDNSVYAFFMWASHRYQLGLRPDQMLIYVASSVLLVSFLLPSIAPYVSWGLYSLWTQFILGPDFQILHPRNATALLLALHIKVVLALLIYCDNVILPITKILGPGWHFLVPCIISIRLNSEGMMVGDLMIGLSKNFLPRRFFPRLRPIIIKKDSGAVDRMMFQLLPGLHESYHALIDSLQLGLRAEVLWLIAVGGIITLYNIDYDGFDLLQMTIKMYSFWYSLRVILPGATGSLQDSIRILENTFSFWVVAEAIATITEVPFIGRNLDSHGKLSAVFLVISTLIGLGAYSEGVGISRAVLQLWIQPKPVEPPK